MDGTKQRFLNELLTFFLLAIGSIPGALIRWPSQNDLLVNVTGAGLLGFIFGLKLKKHFYLIFGIGFCGALTSFSRWMFDSLYFLMRQDFPGLFQVLILHLILGLLASSFGFLLGKQLTN